ncbi:MAG: single-stranded DNA-binding protein [Bacteroidales bacterium]|nr:single-stranded DNA-binding protein [Bacteroidales bacterium]
MDAPGGLFVIQKRFLCIWIEGPTEEPGCPYVQLNYEKLMEQINKIELLGTVGSVRFQHINDKQMAKFALVTNRAYKNKEGAPVIETQWHNITAFEGKNVQDLEKIEKGRAAHVFGRLQVQRYTGVDGVERTSVDVICTRLTILPTDTEVQYEM